MSPSPCRWWVRQRGKAGRSLLREKVDRVSSHPEEEEEEEEEDEVKVEKSSNDMGLARK